LIAPTTRPTARPATTPTTGPYDETAIAETTEARPATEPILKSISAAAITKVIATAMIEIVAVWRAMLSRLLVVVKPLSPKKLANKMNAATKAT
jgi:hypothetical protein